MNFIYESGADSNTSDLVYVRVAEDARPVPGSLVFSVNVEMAPGKFAFVTSNHLYTFRNSNPADVPPLSQRGGGTPPGAAPQSAFETDALTAPAPAAVRPLLPLLSVAQTPCQTQLHGIGPCSQSRKQILPYKYSDNVWQGECLSFELSRSLRSPTHSSP
jgi:hypothetical protein